MLTILSQEPTTANITAHLLETLNFPLLAASAKQVLNTEVLAGYADIILHEATKQCNDYVLAAYEYWL